MENGGGSSSEKKQPATNGGGKPARTHWRHRDPADTAVYVVHPNQFRTVVQQLTGADPASPAPGHTTAPQQPHQQVSACTTANAAAAQQQDGGGTGNVRTLGQMQQECLAWANSEDDD